MRCLVTGATGYLGGRLVPELLGAGHTVRVMVRDPSRLRDTGWAGAVEIATADAGDAAAVGAALAGVDVAYYLIHALPSGSGFARTDLAYARTFGAAARDAGVRRLVYLGGPRVAAAGASAHLRSRQEVGDALLASGVPTVVLRAPVIIGSGSASFEMLRYLVERLPVMVTPRWVRSRVQPLAVRDVLRYLVAAAGLPPDIHGAYDLGGPEVLSYAELIQRFAAAAGLRRRIIIPVPVLSPRLSAYWVNLVTPVPGPLAHPLVASLSHDAVAGEHDIARWIPDPPTGLLDFDTAVRLALTRIREARVETRWSNASWPGAPSEPLPTDPAWAGGSLYVDERTTPVRATPDQLWRVIEGIGGEHGWYSFPLAWAARGWADRLFGGVGLRRGRRDPQHLHVGEALDFWRVEEIDPGRLLRLRAEMRLPGLAWLELSSGVRDGRTVLHQRAVFHPRGLAGHLYWWSVAPFHALVFGGMARNIAAAAGRSRAGRP